MFRVFLRFLSIAAASFLLPLLHQSASAQVPKPFPDAASATSAKDVVENFYRFGSSPMGVHPDSVDRYAIDWFADYLKKRGTEPFWPMGVRFSVDNVYKIYATDSAALVTARTWPDSLPFFGPLTVDWTWFLRRDSVGEWRISYVRRMEGMDKAAELLRSLDSTDALPDRVKPEYARENSAILLSNEQLSRFFRENRASFDSLTGLVTAHDSLRFVERKGDRISQFNLVMIDWGMASEDVPQEVIDEYMAQASPQEKEELEIRMRAAERQKKEGEMALQNYERRAKLKTGTLDKVVSLMKKTRVRFINSELQWKDAILLTMAGNVNDAMGFLYSPHGEMPLISPEEFFYLEDLGNGWWIFRAT